MDAATGFSRKQWKIIVENHPYKQVVAAAGSGKTRTVIGYTQYVIEKYGDFILLLTFSRKACGELQHRLPEPLHSRVEIRTFHAFCYHYLRKYHPVLSGSNFRILLDEEKEKLIKNILLSRPGLSRGIPYDLLIRKFPLLKKENPELYHLLTKEIQDYKEKHNYLEFGDLISIVLQGLEKKENWTEPLKEIYRHVIVDEFQDTDPEQLQFLSLLEPEKLLVVGDDWQAIYGFRGATVEPFLRFRKFFRKAKVFKLDENYRSLEPVVNLGNYVIARSSLRIPKKVRTIRKIKDPFPVLSLEVTESNLKDIVSIVNEYNVMILVRSNYRKAFWWEKGVSIPQVMTIHKAKGLEFPVVFLDISAGWSGESHLTDEEIRILYVGITRAKNLLVLLYQNNFQKYETRLFQTMFLKKSKFISLPELQRFLKKETEFRKAA